MADGPRGRGRGRGRRLVLLLLGATVLSAIAATLALVPRNDEVGDIDAVIVLGGGGTERLELGSAIAREHGVPIVLSAEGIGIGERQGLTCDLDVICIEPDPSTTAGEATAMAELADDRGWDSVVAATSTFHANRSRMLFRQCLGDRVAVVGAPSQGTLTGELYRYSRELIGQVAGFTVRRAC